MKILVINLDRAEGRLAWMKQQFAERELSFERVSAVDGHALSEKDLTELRVERQKYQMMSRGEVGCFLSHRRCWQQILNGTDPYVCIFEDDVHLSLDAAKFLSSPDWIPDETDIVKVETFFMNVVFEKYRRINVFGRMLVKMPGNHSGTGGYILSRECAKKLFERTNKAQEPVDQIVFDPHEKVRRDFKMLQLNPGLCVQDQVRFDGIHVAELESGLNRERTTELRASPLVRPKKPPLQRMVRELIRPLKQSAQALKNLYKNIFYPTIREVVPFKE